MSRVDYPLIYPDLRKNETESSGGYVEMHVTHASHEATRNIETAIILARQGFKVRLLPIEIHHIPKIRTLILSIKIL